MMHFDYPRITQEDMLANRTNESSKPIIGITFEWRSEVNEQGETSYYFYLPRFHDYANAIIRHGGIPYVIRYEDDIQEVASIIDGILLTGGADIHPMFYDQEINGAVVFPDNDRFLYDRSLMEAVSHKLPALGICWGMQFLNVISGGDLIQDIATKDKHFRKPVNLKSEPDSWFYRTFGEKKTCFCVHHQAISRVGKDYVVTSYDDDGIPHSIENISNDSFRVGVQYHPEMVRNDPTEHHINESNDKIFHKLIQKSAEFKKSKRLLTE